MMPPTANRAEALERANVVRLGMTDVRRRLAAMNATAGMRRAAEWLTKRQAPAHFDRMPVGRMLRAIRRVGDSRSLALLHDAGMTSRVAEKRVGELTARQRHALAAALRMRADGADRERRRR